MKRFTSASELIHTEGMQPLSQRISPEDVLGPLEEVEQKHLPAELFVAGDLSLLTEGTRVAVVGSRKASDLGLKRAAKVTKLLVDHGIIVVSGLAEGIDTAAHETALKTGGRTVAVLGTPLEKVFPAKNRALQERLAREHLVVSQFAPASALGKRAFPMRNRTMALLSDATVIIEAAERSGTINQGWEALRLGRTLCILESLVAAGHEWCESMVEHGALVLSDATAGSFLESLPEGSRAERAQASF